MSAQVRPGYSGVQIALHWGIAALVMFQLVFGESMTAVVDAAEEGEPVSALDQMMGNAHFWVGSAIMALALVRVIVRLASRAPVLSEPPTAASRIAGAVHLLFYALLFAVPVSGLLGFYLGDPWGELHTFAKPLFIGLIAAHGGAALFHHFWLKDRTLSRMLVPATRP